MEGVDITSCMEALIEVAVVMVQSVRGGGEHRQLYGTSNKGCHGESSEVGGQ